MLEKRNRRNNVNGAVLISEQTGSVEIFSDSAHRAAYNGTYLELEREFDSAIDYPDITCAGYDLYGWFIKLPVTMDGAKELPAIEGGNTVYYNYFQIAKNGTTGLIWNFLDKTDYIVRIETRWKLQGVKIRLVTVENPVLKLFLMPFLLRLSSPS